MTENDIKVEDIEEGVDTIADIPEADTTDWKAEAQKAQELARQQAGIAKRNATRLKKLREQAQKPPEQKIDEKNEPDYAKLAFLRSNGVSNNDDASWLQGLAKDSGKSLVDLLGAKWVQAELKERTEGRASKNAIPPGAPRSQNSASDTVEYWVAKMEAGNASITDIPDKSLRAKVIAERRKQATSKSMFTDQAVV